ncbi:MAG: hypothetical protein IV090_12265 [Candidatus Sericytochromatia bacterium]|nr:hypothetical protein [Candidatus Sericytochromatia bacterium]
MPNFRDSLRQLFQIFDRESSFILQLLVIFMCSVAVVPALRQALQPAPLRVVGQLPVLTQQMRLPEARPQRITPALREAPKPVQQPLRQQLVPLPVVKMQPLPPRSSRLFSQQSSRLFSQQSNRSVQRKNQTRPPKAVSLHSVKRSPQDPIAPVRSILKQDYKISQASGSYEHYMKWVRSTLKRYQSES